MCFDVSKCCVTYDFLLYNMLIPQQIKIHLLKRFLDIRLHNNVLSLPWAFFKCKFDNSAKYAKSIQTFSIHVSFVSSKRFCSSKMINDINNKNDSLHSTGILDI